MELAAQAFPMKGKQSLAQSSRRRVPRTSIVREKSKPGHEASKVGVSRARWSLINPQAIPLGQRNNDAILLIETNEFEGISRQTTDTTNLREGGQFLRGSC